MSYTVTNCSMIVFLRKRLYVRTRLLTDMVGRDVGYRPDKKRNMSISNSAQLELINLAGNGKSNGLLVTTLRASVTVKP